MSRNDTGTLRDGSASSAARSDTGTSSTTASGIDGLEIHLDLPTVRVPPGVVLDVPVSLRAAEEALPSRSVPVSFRLTARERTGLNVTADARLLGPSR